MKMHYNMVIRINNIGADCTHRLTNNKCIRVNLRDFFLSKFYIPISKTSSPSNKTAKSYAIS